ncbi:MAG: CDP-alcohol phosphatidyltransferase family protein [Akkermansiaceae bacterium]|nr:CDP-alcohol phosphatidyltransferase family protein [Akkermansiaceae bacterium]NNM29590.1 CDP-alcohol phosphatidyltransferase family protein [Akkermansiaceae bacterium]
MTFATQITVARILLVPVFAIFAINYGKSVALGTPDESIRWWAVGVFVVAAASDGIDGWIARRFNQRSRLGGVLDPIADKALVLTALITLSIVEWGANWSLPIWFTVLVIARDLVILGGIAVLHFLNQHVHIAPHWTGKTCTFLLMSTLAWVMLKVIPISPLYPVIVTAAFVVASGCFYLRDGLHQLHEHAQPES